MNMYIVTVKLKLDVEHDPKNKKTGPCPITGNPCTDVTGAHHSFLVAAETKEDARDKARSDGFSHITRIEAA